MKACYASLVIGTLFLIASFLIGNDALDFTYNDSTYFISHSVILGVAALPFFIVSFFLFKKHGVKTSK